MTFYKSQKTDSMMKLVNHLLLSFALLSLFCSCSTVGDYYGQATEFYQYISDFPYFSECETDTLTVQIETTRRTNGGSPFYVMLKGTDFAGFLRDEYQGIADSISFPDEKQTNLATVCMIPGTTRTVKVKKEKDQSVAIYCLFTYPGEIWKHILDNEEGPQKVKFILGESEIKMIKVY